MKLVSLKETLPTAPTDSHVKAHKHHFRRLLATGVLIAGLGIGSVVGITQWTHYKDKIEFVARNPYSPAALEEKFPQRAKLLKEANEYSLRLDKAVGLYLREIKQKSDSIFSARGEPAVFYTLIFSSTGEKQKLTFPKAEKMLMQYLVGGKWNSGHISKEKSEFYMRYFSGPDAVSDMIALFKASELPFNNGRTLFEMRQTATPQALALDKSAYALKIKAKQIKKQVFEWFDNNLDSTVNLFLKGTQNESKIAMSVDAAKSGFRELFDKRESDISQFLLGGQYNQFSLDAAQFAKKKAELEFFSQSLDSVEKLVRIHYELDEQSK